MKKIFKKKPIKFYSLKIMEKYENKKKKNKK